ncbi:putative nicotinamide riboside kinase 1 [Cladorrhinum sp. PSN259]|nr:putative nicotinamide riboside kinase 1 [Cladorrhinum sp. PSN259]
MSPQKAIIIGISGCSSSGKTTLARLLRDIFPNTFILHEDDFYRPESELPTKHGLLDWDCPESLDLPLLQRALLHIRSTGTFPDFISSKEDQNSVGSLPPTITPSLISHLESTIPSDFKTPICVLDGFLLYTHAHPLFTQVLDLLDIKLFLLATKEFALKRRQNRDGYVTLEGFWTDPPGYVEKIVWPNYVEYHKWLFSENERNAEVGKVDIEIAKEAGISVQPWGEEGEGKNEDDDGVSVSSVGFDKVLGWAVGEVVRGVKEKEREAEERSL